MKKLLLFMFVALFGCADDKLEPLSSKSEATVSELSNMIVKMDEFQQLNLLQSKISSQTHTLIVNTNSAYITKYRKVRDKYNSFTDLAATTNSEDHDKFVLLWGELLSPIQNLLTQRKDLFAIISSKVRSKFTATDQDIFKALWAVYNGNSYTVQSNARVTAPVDCDTYARRMGYIWAINFLQNSYDYEYAMLVYDECVIYYTDICNGVPAGPGVGVWC